MNQEQTIGELIELFQFIGTSIPYQTQGQGSNFSVKLKDGQLLIKPSGYRLVEVTSKDHLVLVNAMELNQKLRDLQKMNLVDSEIEKQYADLLRSTSPTSGQLRPSMETGFHALLPHKYVLHFHSLISIIMGTMYETKNADFLKWLKKFPQLSLTPYSRPGAQLYYMLEDYKDFSFIVLARHGVIIQGENTSIYSQWTEIEKSFCENFPEAKAIYSSDPFENKAFPLTYFYPDVAVFAEDLLLRLISDPNGHYTWNPQFKLDDSKNKNLFEIWLANCKLNLTGINLLEIPDLDIQELAKLPTEVLRKKKVISS